LKRNQRNQRNHHPAVRHEHHDDELLGVVVVRKHHGHHGRESDLIRSEHTLRRTLLQMSPWGKMNEAEPGGGFVVRNT